jgi:hypothetical protein
MYGSCLRLDGLTASRLSALALPRSSFFFLCGLRSYANTRRRRPQWVHFAVAGYSARWKSLTGLLQRQHALHDDEIGAKGHWTLYASLLYVCGNSFPRPTRYGRYSILILLNHTLYLERWMPTCCVLLSLKAMWHFSDVRKSQKIRIIAEEVHCFEKSEGNSFLRSRTSTFSLHLIFNGSILLHTEMLPACYCTVIAMLCFNRHTRRTLKVIDFEHSRIVSIAMRASALSVSQLPPRAWVSRKKPVRLESARILSASRK